MNPLDEARHLLRTRRHAEAIALYEKLAHDATAPEGASILSFLSAAYEQVGRFEEAIRTGRKALELAREASNDAAEAHAGVSLGTAILNDFHRKGPSAPKWDDFREAMDLLEHSALLYEREGSVDYASTLLSMAEAYRGVGIFDGAGALYTRVSRELSDERWAASDDLARHTDYLRGRAFMGLGAVGLHDGLREDASDRLDSAVNLLLSGEPQAFKHDLEEIARIFESELDDPEAAGQIRDLVKQRLSER
jgi:tetratricopeptide (TPR) repeat protein